MKILDLLRMSISSLWKRKLRSILTVLGVVIGTASIVVMVSLAIGMNQAILDMIDEFGGLTTINVSAGNQFYGGGSMMMTSSDGSSSDKEEEFLDDNFVETLLAMEHVKEVNPQIQTSAMAKYGSYEAYYSITGMSIEELEALNIPLLDGALPVEGDTELKFLYGSSTLENFYNSKGGKGFWETGILPDIDLLNDPIFIIFDMDAYHNSGWDPEIKPPKKYIIQASGLIDPGEEGWNQHSYRIYCDIEALKTQLKKVFKGKVIPGQPTMPSGKPYKEIFYSGINVEVDNVENMKEVQEAIMALGYEAYSNMEWIESSQKEAAIQQAVLGGIGAVSLFVAAIGITNTMMMSTYERTKEIGVMKVLGCDMRNIRSQFLMEAAYIGFIGGVVGVALSYVISYVINAISVAGETGMETSLIPSWLALGSIGFAILIGMVAGFFPARRAMKLSPLAAIRND